MKQKTSMEETMIMNKKLFFLGSILCTMLYAQEDVDMDLDGIPDSIDKCLNTPFLSEVDSTGCVVNTLVLPDEATNYESLTLISGYGYSTNEDLLSREVQKNTNLEINYYHNDWSYTFHTGYYTHNLHDGLLDTTVKVKKRIKLNAQHILTFGSALIFPTHKYQGNRVDVQLSTSIHAYPTKSLTYFMGYNFTRIGDRHITGEISKFTDMNETKESTALQNIHKFYVGGGYFFTDALYANLTYHLEESKFRDEHNIVSFSASLYYKINRQWFTTLYYKRQIADEDLHDNLMFKLGYHFW